MSQPAWLSSCDGVGGDAGCGSRARVHGVTVADDELDDATRGDAAGDLGGAGEDEAGDAAGVTGIDTAGGCAAGGAEFGGGCRNHVLGGSGGRGAAALAS